MSDINSKYKKILEELENSIKDEEDLAIAKEKFMELTVVFMDIIDRLTYLTDERIKSIEDSQTEINNKLTNVQSIVDSIEEDIYEDDSDIDDGYEFEIVCPYCNYAFTADVADEGKTEIKCPECNNIIELDWNTEEEFSCPANCPHCFNEGVAEENKKYKNKNEDDKNDNNDDKDDDM